MEKLALKETKSKSPRIIRNSVNLYKNRIHFFLKIARCNKFDENLQGFEECSIIF
jgi:hypothetical protein